MDSVAEPIMVVTVTEGNRVSVYYQVQTILRQTPIVFLNRIDLNWVFVNCQQTGTSCLHRHVP